MTPRPEESQNYTVPPNAYVNKAFEKNEKSSENVKTDLSQVPARPIIDFDDLLPHIGEFGRYQKILFLLMIPFAFFVAFVYFSQIFITLVPDEHWCAVPELEKLNYTVEQR